MKLKPSADATDFQGDFIELKLDKIWAQIRQGAFGFFRMNLVFTLRANQCKSVRAEGKNFLSEGRVIIAPFRLPYFLGIH
ncbi:hypothetical protein [Siminovitchia terrae]|uniref:hypothetical protein n=1 Tax=Siminovitchia terrae TaxID=1914933 RepID=UPI001BB3DB07|nr:hypothetical protein [Siminovitchia terrae]